VILCGDVDTVDTVDTHTVFTRLSAWTFTDVFEALYSREALKIL
jgi:hypothetical protein